MSRKDCIPRDTLAALDAYVNDRRPVGGFLHAVLSNRLYEACMRADSSNGPWLRQIALYVEGELPIACRGSAEAVEAWLRGGGE
jgi:hypothetical protein